MAYKRIGIKNETCPFFTLQFIVNSGFCFKLLYEEGTIYLQQSVGTAEFSKKITLCQNA